MGDINPWEIIASGLSLAFGLILAGFLIGLTGHRSPEELGQSVRPDGPQRV